MEEQSAWYNHQADKYDYRSGIPKTDEEAEQYIPQGAGVNLYRLLRKDKGHTIAEAMLHVLYIATGTEPPD